MLFPGESRAPVNGRIIFHNTVYQRRNGPPFPLIYGDRGVLKRNFCGQLLRHVDVDGSENPRIGPVVSRDVHGFPRDLLFIGSLKRATIGIIARQFPLRVAIPSLDCQIIVIGKSKHMVARSAKQSWIGLLDSKGGLSLPASSSPILFTLRLHPP